MNPAERRRRASTPLDSAWTRSTSSGPAPTGREADLPRLPPPLPSCRDNRRGRCAGCVHVRARCVLARPCSPRVCPCAAPNRAEQAFRSTQHLCRLVLITAATGAQGVSMFARGVSMRRPLRRPVLAPPSAAQVCPRAAPCAARSPEHPCQLVLITAAAGAQGVSMFTHGRCARCVHVHAGCVLPQRRLGSTAEHPGVERVRAFAVGAARGVAAETRCPRLSGKTPVQDAFASRPAGRRSTTPSPAVRLDVGPRRLRQPSGRPDAGPPRLRAEVETFSCPVGRRGLVLLRRRSPRRRQQTSRWPRVEPPILLIGGLSWHSRSPPPSPARLPVRVASGGLLTTIDVRRSGRDVVSSPQARSFHASPQGTPIR